MTLKSAEVAEPMEGTSDRLESEQATILILVCAYVPGYKAGGPIRSIENLVSALGHEFHFKIVTMDRDLGEHLPFPGIVTNRWVRVGQAEVIYLQPGFRSILDMFRLLRSVDSHTVVYLNCYFGRRFSMLPLLMRWLSLCRPRSVVLAPRGEFSRGALESKRRRKLLYLRLSRWVGLTRGLIWQASSRFEAADISRCIPLAEKVEVASAIAIGHKQASYLATASDISLPGVVSARETLAQDRTKRPGRLRAVLISRISRMKNLVGALRMLNSISGDVSFDIYGPLEDPGYWEDCQCLIAALPANVHVRYCGEIAHQRVSEILAECDLFLLPTLGENYCHVIAEAFAAGCPVLVSDRTPWRGLEERGVGWDLPLIEPERFRQVLQHCVDMGPEEHSTMRARAAALAASQDVNATPIEQNRHLFRFALVQPAKVAVRNVDEPGCKPRPR